MDHGHVKEAPVVRMHRTGKLEGNVLMGFFTFLVLILCFMIEAKLVLFAFVGPKDFRNVSDICLKSVRKLSVTKNCQKSV